MIINILILKGSRTTDMETSQNRSCKDAPYVKTGI
ncbi:MAG: hypothetical protein VB114_01115 [Lutispora sp.]|nr:hypothetical protein [Lutispora sp.]MEA4960251.1 hypothetical protein [Lutispora sp.]